jgi:sortase B
MDFTDLLAMNPEIVGRLVIEGIGLDEPVVQGTDNGYYLTHTPERKVHKDGSLFLDYRLNKDFANFNSVVYGHYRSTGEMFGKLKTLRRQAAFDRVTEGMLYTPEKTYRLEIFASVLTPATSEFYHLIFLGRPRREMQLEMIRDEAVCYRDVGATPDDRLLTLSTCSYEYEWARTVIIARLVG